MIRSSGARTAADRVKELIDRYHDGNVTAAAKAAGVPYRSAVRLYNGAKQPRADVLLGLAKHFGTTSEWLATGEGAGPTGPTTELLPSSQLERWHELIASLNLPPNVERAWRGLPMSIGNAGTFMRVNYPAPRTPAMVRAMGHEVWAWTMYLNEWIEIDGLEKVGRAMRKPEHLVAARLGFSWFGAVLLQKNPEVAAMVAAIATEHAQDAESSPPRRRR